MNAPEPERRINFFQACAVRNRAICADLDDDEIKLLNPIGRRRTLEAGEQLLWEGDDAILVANVIEGILKLSSQTADGKEQIPGLAYPPSRQQIADVPGLTIETVSRQFTRMRADGLIDLPSRREVAILQREVLEDRAA